MKKISKSQFAVLVLKISPTHWIQVMSGIRNLGQESAEAAVLVFPGTTVTTWRNKKMLKERKKAWQRYLDGASPLSQLTAEVVSADSSPSSEAPR